MLKSFLALPLALITGAALLPAQSSEYFPLKTGSSWTYRQTESRFGTPAEIRTITVGQKETFGDREYFRTDFFGRTLLLRANPDGSVVSYDPEAGVEQAWISLGGVAGNTFESHIDDCTEHGKIESRRAQRSTPAGSFSDVVEVSFSGHCADAGATREFWAPGVGLVSHEETSFAGPRTWDLVAYRPAADIAAPEVAFTFGIDSPVYLTGDTMNVRLTLTSTSDTPIQLTFPSGQSYDLKLYNEAGDVVYTWSANRLFTMIFRQEMFGPGTRTYAFSVPLGTLAAGRYTARAWLTTDPVRYAGETGFEISEVRANPADALGIRRR